VPGVTASVLPFADLVKALDVVHFGQVSGLFEITKEVITLGIDVRGDVMRDLTRRVTEANPLVVAPRSGPMWAAVEIDLVRTPKTNMMALSWVVADGLLESKVLFAPPHKEITDWSIIIRLPEDRVRADPRFVGFFMRPFRRRSLYTLRRVLATYPDALVEADRRGGRP
jgi:hypothetical protein